VGQVERSGWWEGWPETACTTDVVDVDEGGWRGACGLVSVQKLVDCESSPSVCRRGSAGRSMGG